MSTAVSTTDLTQLTGEYSIDTAHSRIGFHARHAMVTKVRGAFNEFVGTLHLDGTDPSQSSAAVTIQATSIDTRNADRDAHLRGNDFFNMEEFPTISFASTKAEQVDPDHYLLTGDLTIRGIARPVSIPFEFSGTVVDPWGNTRVGFEGSVVINRKDWGINFNAALEAGGLLVSEKVTLEFELSAVKVG
jgi:polyisoprenoid-binding protein YceI